MCFLKTIMLTCKNETSWTTKTAITIRCSPIAMEKPPTATRFQIDTTTVNRIFIGRKKRI
jgi:hypothetical protein